MTRFELRQHRLHVVKVSVTDSSGSRDHEVVGTVFNVLRDVLEAAVPGDLILCPNESEPEQLPGAIPTRTYWVLGTIDNHGATRLIGKVGDGYRN
jgi:hypothetical protein